MKKLFYTHVLALTLLFSFPFLCLSQSTPGVSAPGEGFSAVLGSVGGSGTPQIGEWTRTAGGDESVVVTGEQFSRYSGGEEGKDTRFLVYAAGGVKKEARIQRLDGQKAIITLS